MPPLIATALFRVANPLYMDGCVGIDFKGAFDRLALGGLDRAGSLRIGPLDRVISVVISFNE